MNDEIDVGPAAVLDQAELARLADAVTVEVGPEPEHRRIGVGLERIDQDVARIRTWRVLPQRRPETLVTFRADRRSAEAARCSACEQHGAGPVPHRSASEHPAGD